MVYDSKFTTRRKEIFVGAVGTSRSLQSLREWIKKCTSHIDAKTDNNQPNLYTSFCGFNEHGGFNSTLVFEEALAKKLLNKDINKILKIKSWNKLVSEAVDLYYDNIRFLAQNRNVDVIVCILPNNLYNKTCKKETTEAEETIDDDEPDIEMNFRRALKAKSMHLARPIQLIREQTFKDTASQQDIATKAWNFCTAIYYKAGQTVPWKLIRNEFRSTACYVGIGFYRSRDKKILNTSLAQIFNELGDGVILRGTQVDINKDDRRPHLTEAQSYKLLSEAINEYEFALETSPGRLVIHKTSIFSGEEIAGLREAAEDRRINAIDFITILDPDIRLFRHGIYPPARGTHIILDENHQLLYTKGSVMYYQTYPGPYIPQPIEIRIFESEESPELICEEILSLTKMNWNNTQFDGKYPITIECARRVGQIMKYLDENDKPQIKYSFYM
jgi:argonaute-like protein implicated in RNA metabolism and viral defense